MVFSAKKLYLSKRRLVAFFQKNQKSAKNWLIRWVSPLLAMTLISNLAFASQQQPNPENQYRPADAWMVAFDNDILVPGHRDQDYTYGISFAQINAGLADANVSLNRPLRTLDQWIGNEHASIHVKEAYSRELGVFGFTPEDISLPQANPNDRPYASLMYFSSTRDQVDFVNNVAWKSTFTLGVLGSDLVGKLQREVHSLTQSEMPQGWDNQISQGGELTGRYLLARQQYLDELSDKYEIKSTLQASLGYLTEVSWGMNIRRGKIHSPWASFNPDLTSYGEKSSSLTQAKNIDEHYLWAGFAIKARAYNAFLQGQFRDSPVVVTQSEIKPLLVEAWIGYTFAFKQGYRISYVLRGHSSEIKQGAGDRNLLWGGIIVSHNI
jgi:hypothetical protein